MRILIPARITGEMARRIREMDWSATPLGSSEAWPQSLKLSLTMILASGFPMAIRWGPELVLMYNDAYRPILRDKHPEALGSSLREVWWEIYPELGPLNEAILRGEREAFFAEDHPWTLRRQGAPALPEVDVKHLLSEGDWRYVAASLIEPSPQRASASRPPRSGQRPWHGRRPRGRRPYRSDQRPASAGA